MIEVSGMSSLLLSSHTLQQLNGQCWCTTTVLSSKGCIYSYCVTSMNSFGTDVASDVVLLDCSVENTLTEQVELRA